MPEVSMHTQILEIQRIVVISHKFSHSKELLLVIIRRIF